MIDLESRVSPEVLFSSGLLVFPAFLFTDFLWTKLFLASFYMLLSALTGKRVRVLPNLIVGSGVVFANIFTPFGRVFFRLGSFPLTEGALRLGLLKAATLIGLIYLSRLTIRSTLRFPGRIGQVLALMFYYFERITERKIKIDRKNVWESVAVLVREVYNEAGAAEFGPGIRHGSRPEGLALAGLFVGFNWALFLIAKSF